MNSFADTYNDEERREEVQELIECLRNAIGRRHNLIYQLNKEIRDLHDAISELDEIR